MRSIVVPRISTNPWLAQDIANYCREPLYAVQEKFERRPVTPLLDYLLGSSMVTYNWPCHMALASIRLLNGGLMGEIE